MGRRPNMRGALRQAVQSLWVRPEAQPPQPTSGRPIVVLHCFAATSRVLLHLERHLRRELRRPVIRLDLGRGLCDIRDSARRTYESLERIAAAPDFEFADLVAHSMGGLVAAYLLKCLDQGRRVRRVVTLGTPHRGTPLALAGVLTLGFVSRAVWQMLPSSPLLQTLASLPVPDGSKLIAVAAGEDSVVPQSFARLRALPGQRNARLERANHFELIQARDALSLTSSLLEAA